MSYRYVTTAEILCRLHESIRELGGLPAHRDTGFICAVLSRLGHATWASAIERDPRGALPYRIRTDDDALDTLCQELRVAVAALSPGPGVKA